jgi:hypothetical protein
MENSRVWEGYNWNNMVVGSSSRSLLYKDVWSIPSDGKYVPALIRLPDSDEHIDFNARELIKVVKWLMIQE